MIFYLEVVSEGLSWGVLAPKDKAGLMVLLLEDFLVIRIPRIFPYTIIIIMFIVAKKDRCLTF